MEKKALMGLVLSLIVVVLLGVALVGTWWTYEMEGTGGSVTVDRKLQEGTITTEVAGTSTTETKAYKDTTGYEDSAAFKVYDNTYYITIAALILSVITLILLILVGIGKVALVKIGVIFLLITMIFAVVAPVYFAVALPGAMDEDAEDTGGYDKGFMGSESDYPMAGTDSTWGPGYGWYLAIVAFVFALIGLIITVIPGKKAVPAPVAPSL